MVLLLVFKRKFQLPKSKELSRDSSQCMYSGMKKQPRGWYLSTVNTISPREISPGGMATVYESVSHREVDWASAHGNGKWDLPHSSMSAGGATRFFTALKVKGFADDISVFSNTVENHATTPISHALP